MSTETDTAALRDFIASQSFDENLSDYKQDLYPGDKLSYDKGNGPYYNYILDWQTQKYAYLSKGIEQLVGEGDLLASQGLEAFFQLLNPDDSAAFLKIVSKWMALLLGKPEEEFNRYAASFNFRIRKRKGIYINLLQQPIYTSFDKEGNIVYEAGLLSDISRYRSDGNISLSIIGPEGEQLVEYYPKEDFAPKIGAVRDKITEIERFANENSNTFIRNVQKALANEAQTNQFGVTRLSNILNISRAQLYRKVKAAIGTSPSRLIRLYRLQQSLEHLAQKKMQISEVAYRHGFSSPTYFAKCFQEEFDCTPSRYRKEVQ